MESKKLPVSGVRLIVVKSEEFFIPARAHDPATPVNDCVTDIDGLTVQEVIADWFGAGLDETDVALQNVYHSTRDNRKIQNSTRVMLVQPEAVYGVMAEGTDMAPEDMDMAPEGEA